MNKYKQEELDKDIEAIFLSSFQPLSNLAYSIIKNGESVFQGTFLHPHLQTFPYTPSTHYRIASISKMFTALGVLKLWDEGKLNLSENISNYLGFEINHPHFSTPITTQMLLNHTSTLRDNDAYLFPENISISDFLKDSLKAGTHWYLKQKPGEFFSYENLNYVILGTLIECISKTRFDIYMKKNILETMGLKCSFNVDDIPIEERGCLYMWNATTKDFKITINDMTYTSPITRPYTPGSNGSLYHPQGGLRISLNDLTQFIMLQLNPKVLYTKLSLKSSFEKLYEITWENKKGSAVGNDYRDFKGAYTCFGLHYLKQMSGEYYGHTGDAYGLNAAVYFSKICQTGFVIIFNGVSNEFLERKEDTLFFKPIDDIVNLIKKKISL